MCLLKIAFSLKFQPRWCPDFCAHVTWYLVPRSDGPSGGVKTILNNDLLVMLKWNSRMLLNVLLSCFKHLCCLLFNRFYLFKIINKMCSTHFIYIITELKLDCFLPINITHSFSLYGVLLNYTHSYLRGIGWLKLILLRSMLPKFSLHIFLKFHSFILTVNSSRFSFLKLIPLFHKHWKDLGDW